jgi:mitotic spindle assembly checkpoint protein MAD1
MAPPDADEYESQRRCIEELKAEIGTLRYSITTFEQEKVMSEARHNSEMEEQRRKAQDDYEKRQAAEGEKDTALRLLESLKNELNEAREATNAEKTVAERRARDAEEEARLLQEQLEDLSSAKDEAARIGEKKITDLQMQADASKRAVQDLEQEAQAREAVLQQTQAQVAEKDGQIGNLEAEILRLKAQTGDADTIAIVKKELSEQVRHIRTLEATNREQLAELKHFRQVHKAVEVVEEEKRSLLRKLEAAKTLEAQLTEARMQRQRLEDERLAWTAYLKSAAETDSETQFDSPEAMVRALVEERFASASYVEKIGGLQAELAAHQATILSFEEEKMKLKSEIEKARTTSGTGNADKARMRIDRQRALAVKEVEYLRAQLKVFDDEDKTFQPSNYDEQKVKRIQELEGLVDGYKAEVQSLRTELDSLEPSTSAGQPAAGAKRPRTDDEEHEQLGQLLRKNRKLQDDMSTLQTAHAVLQKELQVSREQLAAAKEQNKVRILSLRSNPTSDSEAIKISTLNALKLENEELRKHMERQPATYTTMPATQLLAAQREIADAKAETASARKSAQRLKEVWAAKSQEFKEAIFSTLGWTVVFMPNGKMRVESVFYRSQTDEHENSIVFDGEKGTMKVAGGPRSAFAGRIADQIKFWVRERGCIPGFLAALTLEFYDEHTRAANPS